MKKYPFKIRTKDWVMAHCTPINVAPWLPPGVIGDYWDEANIYCFPHFDGYVSWIPADFILLSDRFKIVK